MKTIKKYLKLFQIIAPEYTVGTLGLLFLIFLFVFYPSNAKQQGNGHINLLVPEQPTTAFENLDLKAKAVYIYDVKRQKEIYSKNSDSQLPLASLTKVMMAVTALSLVPESTIITISPEFLKTEGDSGFATNEKWKLKDLLNLTLLESSNDGATAIASAAGAKTIGGVPDDWGREEFIKAMNKVASKLDLEQTYFINPTGLDESTSVSGSYGSARDMAKLMSYAITEYPTLFDATRNSTGEFSSLSSTHSVKNTNTFVNKIPSLLASKTGYTDLAGGNLVIAFDAGFDHPIVISVLGSTEQGRFEDTEKLVWTTLDYISI